jgi:hypothetical protein
MYLLLHWLDNAALQLFLFAFLHCLALCFILMLYYIGL